MVRESTMSPNERAPLLPAPPAARQASSASSQIAQLLASHAHTASAGSHSALLRRLRRGAAGEGLLIEMQRSYGNQHVQRVLQKASQADSGEQVPAEVQRAIDSARGSGQPLETQVQRQMESSFGSDFGGVRIHTDRQAHELNQAVSAVAFTTGNDIFFSQGAYQPQSSSGRELLAHELTHVVQQGGSPGLQGRLTVGAPDDAYEQEADRVARAVVDGWDQQDAAAAAKSGGAAVKRKCACMEHGPSDDDCEECRAQKLGGLAGGASSAPGGKLSRSPQQLQRVHLDAAGRKAFDCSDYIGDKKLEACLNDEDRLSPGESGASVIKVQNGLIKDGADLGPTGADGKYGALTGQAVMAFKTKYHLGFEQYPDVGPGTMAKLDELCANQPPKPNPNPNPTPQPTTCFDSIDWDAFFDGQDEQCRLDQASIDAICNLAPNSPFNLGPDMCPKTPFEERVEDCVAFAGFTELFTTCGVPTSGPGKKEIRDKYKDWKKRHGK
jgi:hypothetical protein